MDRIRQFADHSVRRAAGFGLLAIALIVLALHADRSLSMHVLAFLLTFEAIALYCCGRRADRVAYHHRKGWPVMDRGHGISEDRVQRLISAIMRETFMAYARRMAGPAVAAWVVDVGMGLSG